jgi:hypothetical protein
MSRRSVSDHIADNTTCQRTGMRDLAFLRVLTSSRNFLWDTIDLQSIVNGGELTHVSTTGRFALIHVQFSQPHIAGFSSAGC